MKLTIIVVSAVISLLTTNTQAKPIQTNIVGKTSDTPVEAPKIQETVAEVQVVAEAPKAAPVASVPVTGTCSDWMTAAGVTDQANAYILIMRESGCNPNSVNRSSGACGIGQQLPCGKWPHTWNDPVGAMIDMQNYVVARYGSWANAVAHSTSVGWY